MTSRLLSVILLLVVAGCGEARPDEREFGLEEVQRYGSTEKLDTDAVGASDDLGGGLLAGIAGIGRDASGLLYVLDRGWKKIVAFRLDGSLSHVLRGGAGDGPGEFRLPVDLTLSADGVPSVLDYELGRITYFGEAGPTVARLDMSHLIRHVVAGDTVFAARATSGASHWPSVWIFSSEGDSIGVGPTPSDEDQAYGSPIGLALTGEGGVLVSSRRPGVWLMWERRAWSTIGTPLFPESLPPTVEQLSPGLRKITSSSTRAEGIAAVGSDLVVQSFVVLPNHPEESPTEGWLGFFTRGGQHLGSLRLPDEVRGACIVADPASGNLFLCVSSPVPQVVEYRITREP